MPLELLDGAWRALQARSENAARDSRWFFDFFDGSPEACLITDRHAMIRSANLAAARLLGRARHYLPGKPLAVFVPLAERRAFRRNVGNVGERARWACSVFRAEVRRSPRGLCWTLS